MKFSCEKEILLGLLGTASRAVTGKSSMPLLEGLLICADASTLTVTGYDMSIGIRTTTETDVVEPGSIVINARLLLDIVRKLPNDVVYIETDDKLMTTVKCGRAVFNLAATEADEFPALAEVSSATGFSLPQNILKSMISQTIFSVSDNESKPIHTGCLFELGWLAPQCGSGRRLPSFRTPRDHRRDVRGNEIRGSGRFPARNRAHSRRG